MRFYTTAQLGTSQALTHEGFLVISDVPAARTGEMIYGPDEVPVRPNSDGIVRITRDEAEVFRPEFLASLNGKPVVDDHPNEDVCPDNWRQYAVGHGMNPRRGTGMQADLLVMDIMITDKAAIEAVRQGKRQISLGYEADYEETGPGEGRQLNLIGNHIALVDAGRCGPRCAIGDKRTTTGDCTMTTKTRDKKSWLDRIRDALGTKDEAKIATALDEAARALDDEEPAGGGIHIHTGGAPAGGGNSGEGTEARFAAIESALAALKEAVDKLVAAGAPASTTAPLEEAQEELEEELEAEAPAEVTADKARKARDSMYLEDSFQDTVAAAEILVPGIKIPTFDRASAPKKTLDAICKLRRSALDLAYATAEGRGMIEDINGKQLDLERMSCGAVRTLFRSAVAMKKNQNNASARTGDGSHVAVGGGMGIKGAVRTPADLNRALAEHYKRK